jgi:hypothetical protein|tara:strand:- start:399 stop:635 length:237 start_codon:yes stop_codon:yes gene_type:complete
MVVLMNNEQLDVKWTNNYYKIGWNHTIWVCYDCGEMFDGELCTAFTGQCYTCYPRPDKMKGDLSDMKDYEARKEGDDE